MYNFIVDYFEDPIDANAKKESKALLAWWNK